MGFLNPGLRVLWGHGQMISDPDPKRRLHTLGIKIPMIMFWAALAAAINYLITIAGKNKEEKEAILE